MNPSSKGKPLTEQIEKKKPGRQLGWQKSGKFTAKLPPIRISDELHAWLESEKERIGVATLSDIVRIKLTEAKNKG